jgi:bifunctional NMN adenylyltransferase/nudix hydrolase
MISLVYPEEVAAGRIIMRPLDDFTYSENRWVEEAQHIVKTILIEVEGNSSNVTLHGMNDLNIGLIGCNKDHTSYYLKLFPNWADESVEFLNPINATDIRHDYFGIGLMTAPIPSLICGYLNSWQFTETYATIRNEIEFVKNYKRQWVDNPYPPTFVTVDALVVQSGHLLVVRRGAQPGRGLIALPGGFIGEHELIDDAVFRELREETGIKVPEPVLRGSVTAKKVFDEPNRSRRGRTITHAYLIELENRDYLPDVKGGDDAEKAFWMPLADVHDSPKEFYEDHWFIIQNMIN